MKSFFIHYKYHFLLLCIGLIWLAIFDFLTQMSAQGIIYMDSESYMDSAKNLYIFSRGHNYRPILMAVINGIPYLFGASDQAIYDFSFYVNVVCWLAFFLILFEILKDFLRPKVAFFFALIPIFFVGNAAFIFHLLTENIYMLFIISGFYFLMKYFKTNGFGYLSAGLSIFILSMLIRPGSKFFAIVLGLFFIRAILKNYKSKFIWLLYGSLLLVFIQCAGIRYQFGNFTLSYIDVVTYYNYIGSKAMLLKEGKEYTHRTNPRVAYIFSMESKDQKRVASADLKQQLQFNSGNLAKAYFSDVIENSVTGNICIEDCKNSKNRINFDFWKELMFSISQWQNRIWTPIGFLLAVFYFFKSYKKEVWFSMIAFFILYTMILSGISCGQGDRFHVITFPFVLILLAKFIKETTNAIQKN